MTISQDPSAPLFAVVGSTGSQGSSTIDAIRSSSNAYRVRAITRDSTKPAAKKLAEIGCELIEADAYTEDGAERAFDGATYVFGMTSTDIHSGDNQSRQYKQGVVLVEAAKEKHVETFLWSGEPHLGKLSGGKLECHIFDVKAEIADHARSIGLNIVEINPGFFMTALLELYSPRKQADGSFALWLPVKSDTKMPLIDVERDLGRYVVSALEGGRTAPVVASAEYLTPVDMAKKIGQVTGKKVSFIQASDDAFKSHFDTIGFSGLGDLVVNMGIALREVGYYGGADLTESNFILADPPRGFDQFLEVHKAEFSKNLE